MSKPAFSVARQVFLVGALSASVSIAASLAAQTAESPAEEQSETAEETEMTKGEKRLAKLLEGRVAGDPQRCIRTFPVPPITVIDETAIIYGRGNTIYVQRTARPEAIDRSDVISVRQFRAGRLCKLDMVQTSERISGIVTGNVMLEEFVPYTRVDKKES
ncbi:MAG: hypothetical protein AAF709_08950 [Pseudomonadota bacterium]